MTTTTTPQRPLVEPEGQLSRSSSTPITRTTVQPPFQTPKSIRRDQHPYAIKTTSTALLTRSNSTGYATHTQHSYVPTSPSPHSKHRYSRSDVTNGKASDSPVLNIAPRPLPIPPALESPTKSSFELRGGYASSDDLRFLSLKTRRADTLSGLPAPPPPSPVKLDDLPSNPKIWTTAQLASYLITALRVKSGESLPLPLPVAKDIAAFVKEARLNGRSFLRLDEHDLESMGVNGLWREALLDASRNLRQNVVKGRIWGFGADEQEENVFMSPYRHNLYDNSSSSSIDDLPGSLETTPSKSRAHGHRSGRVRGLIANLERSSSSGSGSGGSGFSNRGSSTSEGDAYGLAGAWADDEGAFASGSEASEVEDDRVGTVTNKQLVQEPVTPPMEILQEIPGDVEVATPEGEQTVEELLAVDNVLSHSWGARAWEEIDLNAGETVKRVLQENDSQIESPYRLSPTHTGVISRRGSGRGSGKSKELGVYTKLPLRDIFSRPLPTPPKSNNSPSSGGDEILDDSPRLVGDVLKLDLGIQTDSDADVVVQRLDQGQQTERNEDDAMQLQAALALVNIFKARLEEVEKKLDDIERQDAQRGRVEYNSQVVEADEEFDATAKASETAELRATQSEDTGISAGELGHAFPPLAMTGLQDSSAGDAVEEEPRQLVPAPAWNDIAVPSIDWDPLENGLPSYVLMVGVGVCAVVLSTIFKRLAGKRS